MGCLPDLVAETEQCFSHSIIPKKTEVKLGGKFYENQENLGKAGKVWGKPGKLGERQENGGKI